MNLVILSPGKEVFKGEITSVKVPGNMGEFQVLKGHSPLVSSLGRGTVYVQTQDGNHDFKINNGFIEVLNNEVSILVQSIVD